MYKVLIQDFPMLQSEVAFDVQLPNVLIKGIKNHFQKRIKR